MNDTPQNRRKNLRAAAQLLDQAGWKVTQEGGKSLLKNDKGEHLTVSFLLDSPLFERIALPYQQQLELLGIGVTIKTVDSAQYERQVQTFDYDIIVGSWGQSLSPGNEQRDFWGSEAAKRNGSRNYVGIANPAIDTLIEAIIFAPDRPASSPPARRWTGRSSGTTTWCRCGTSTTSAPPAGTASAGRQRFPPTAWASPASGGGTRRGPARWPPSEAASHGCRPLPADLRPALAEPRHGLSIFGDLKYPAGFEHFDT